MILTPLPAPSPAGIRDALARRGISPVQAEAAANGLDPTAIMLDGLTSAEREQVARAAADLRIECLTGEGWALLAGGQARLAGMVRAPNGGLPAALTQQLGRVLQGRRGPSFWEMARGAISLAEPVVVAVINVTPDSFSDGARYDDPERALAHAAQLVAEGAQMLDLGAESTRPSAPKVPSQEEWRRLQPVLTAVIRRFPTVPISVDTVKESTARRALDAGAWAINDVSGLRLDPGIAEVCAAHGAGLVLMHSRGDVASMASYEHATYRDVTGEVIGELDGAARLAQQRGVRATSIVLDPGLGFSKTPEQTYEALRAVPALGGLGYPVMLGPSRKRFLGAVTGRAVSERDGATAAACAVGWVLGAKLFRVHVPGSAREALAVAHAVGIW